MDTQKVVDKEFALSSTITELTRQIENLDKAVHRLQLERNQLVANLNASSGAKQVLQELLESEKATEKAE